MFDDVDTRYEALDPRDRCTVLGFVQDQLSKARSGQQTADSLAGDLNQLPEYLRCVAQDCYEKRLLGAAHSRQKQTDITIPD
jgi:hypothetical protein